MNRVLYQAWDCDPPRIHAISQAMPDAPPLHLSGGCMARMSLESFIRDLESDFEKQKGQYYAYVMEADREEADTFILKTWEVYTSPESCYEAMVILYYAPLNPYLTYKKHMGEECAREYLEEQQLVNN